MALHTDENVEQPTVVMYDTLVTLGLKEYEAGAMLFSPKAKSMSKQGDDYIVDKLKTGSGSARSWLVRAKEISSAYHYESQYRPFAEGAASVLSAILHKGKATHDELIALLSGDACVRMQKSLSAHHRDYIKYENVVAACSESSGLSDADRLTALMIAFLAVGCTLDSDVALKQAEQFIDGVRSGKFKTRMPEATDSVLDAADLGAPQLMLRRFLPEQQRLMGEEYSLSQEGVTVIGAFPDGQHTITAPAKIGGVSRAHLKIWCQGDKWYAQGAGSTYGTTVRHPDGSVDVIELPKTDRSGQTSDPVEININDTLCLGGALFYQVMADISEFWN